MRCDYRTPLSRGQLYGQAASTIHVTGLDESSPELLPESWQFDGVVSSCCQQQAQAHRAYCKSPVTDIALWCECYGTLVAVLATRYAQYTLELMAYQRTVVRAARNFEGTAWVTYDVLPQESCPPQGSGPVKGRP